MKALTLSPPDGSFGPMTNTVKDNFLGGEVQNIVDILMAVFNDRSLAPNLFDYVTP